MMDGYNDNELLYLLSENDEFAFEMLMDKYQPMIMNRLKRYHVKTEYWDDYYQECIILLYKCAMTYREDITKTFNKYYDRLLQYQIRNLLRKDRQSFYRVVLMSPEEMDTFAYQRVEEKSILSSIRSMEQTLDETLVKMLSEGATIQEIADFKKLNYYQAYNLVKKYRKKNFVGDVARKPLSKLESAVYELAQTGYKPKEIASLLAVECSTVYNTLKRVREKIKKGIVKND